IESCPDINPGKTFHENKIFDYLAKILGAFLFLFKNLLPTKYHREFLSSLYINCLNKIDKIIYDNKALSNKIIERNLEDLIYLIISILPVLEFYCQHKYILLKYSKMAYGVPLNKKVNSVSKILEDKTLLKIMPYVLVKKIFVPINFKKMTKSYKNKNRGQTSSAFCW
ncbi:hypothetical protein HZS_4504, partial [Henneguya salminicola]